MPKLPSKKPRQPSKIQQARRRSKAQLAKLSDELQHLKALENPNLPDKIRQQELEMLLAREKQDIQVKEQANRLGISADREMWTIRAEVTKRQRDDRRAAIARLVGANIIQTKAHLTRLLNDAGFVAGDATIATDMRALGVVLYRPSPSDTKRYAILKPEVGEVTQQQLLEYEFASRVSYAVEEVLRDERMVYVTCVDKMAGAVTDILREQGYPDVLSVLNDSAVVWIACADDRAARNIETILRKYVILGS